MVSRVNKHLLFFFWILMPIGVLAQEKDFLDRVLDYHNCRECYFIALDVESDVYNGKAVIENDDLFWFLRKEKGFNETQYKSYIKGLLKTGKKLVIKNASLSPAGLALNVKNAVGKFRILQGDTEFQKKIDKGCRFVLSEFFTSSKPNSSAATVCDGVLTGSQERALILNKPLVDGQPAALIAQLFEWQIAVRTDHLSGMLVIN